MSPEAWEIVIGVMVGAVVRFALPSKNPGGLVVSMMVGVIGAVAAMYLGEKMGWYQVGTSTQFLVAAAGAAALVAIYRFLSGTTAKQPKKEDEDL